MRRDLDGVVDTMNHADGDFSQLKRSLEETHHHVKAEGRDMEARMTFPLDPKEALKVLLVVDPTTRTTFRAAR